eukprot:177381-Chlamydomonas_euryale.AAC.3
MERTPCAGVPGPPPPAVTSRIAWISCPSCVSASRSLLQHARMTGTSGLTACTRGYQSVRIESRVACRRASKHTTIASACRIASSTAAESSGRDDVSVISMGTPSGEKSRGSRTGGSTGGGLSSNVSLAAVLIRDVLPV